MGKYQQTGQQTALQTAAAALYYTIVFHRMDGQGLVVYGMVFLLKGRAISIQKIKTIIHLATVHHHLDMELITAFQDSVM